MKKALSLILVLVLALSVFAGCASGGTGGKTGGKAEDTNTQPATGTADKPKIVIGASPTPHKEILDVVKGILANQGYELEIVEFTDYVLPNMSLEDGSLDANYFQHQPYLDDFNAEKKTNIVSIASIHFEPLGIYPGKTKSLADLKDGAQIAVPNDTTNEARALLLLEAQGLIKLKADAGLKATINDITENPKKLKIVEIEAAQLARSLQDVDMAVINGNYAIDAGLNVSKDALAKEDPTSIAAQTFANILAVRAGDENREDLKALAAVLKSEEVRKFIEDTYQGAVVPVF
jgi:D-methionine transport system substrate-binding protein